MNEYMLYQPLTAKGLGVVARKDIRSGTPLEHAAAKEISPALREHLADTELAGLDFVVPEDFDPRHPDKRCRGRLLLGMASLCNHSTLGFNAEMSWTVEMCGVFGILQTVQPIKMGDEILINYVDFLRYPDRDSWAP